MGKIPKGHVPLIRHLLAMVTRGVAHPRLLQNLPYLLTRRLCSAPSPVTAVPSLTFEGKTHPQEPTFINPVDTTTPPGNRSATQILSFEDVKGLFSTVSTPKLLKSWATLQMTAIEPLVDVGLWVMNSRLVKTPGTKQVILEAIRHTFYDHFCAGEDLEKAGRTVTRLWDAGLRGMLDYSLEHATDNESCDRNSEEFIKTVECTKSLPPTSVSVYSTILCLCKCQYPWNCMIFSTKLINGLHCYMGCTLKLNQ